MTSSISFPELTVDPAPSAAWEGRSPRAPATFSVRPRAALAWIIPERATRAPTGDTGEDGGGGPLTTAAFAPRTGAPFPRGPAGSSSRGAGIGHPDPRPHIPP